MGPRSTKEQKHKLWHTSLHRRAPHTDLGQVAVHGGLVRIPLEVLSLDEVLDTLLDELRVRLEEGELREHLRDKLLVTQRLPHLHDPYDRGLDRDRPVLLHSLLVVRLLGD